MIAATLLLALDAAAAGPVTTVDDFALLDHTGAHHRLGYHTDASAVVLFVQGNGCPIARNALPALRAIREAYAARGVLFWMLNANLQDDRDSVAREAADYAIDFPILLDETQLVAESLGVTRTAEALVIDPKSGSVVYRGPVDDRMHYEAQRPARETFLADALAAHLSGEEIETAERPAPGCLIHFPNRDREAHHEISYSEDIAPLLQQRCRSCHRQGGVAPWAMTHYEMVRGWSPMMREMIRTRRMPPWHADPRFQRFENDLSLTSEEKKTLVHWIEAGSPRGSGPDPLDASPGGAPPRWALGKPDLLLTAPRQELPATGVVDYRYETLDLPMERDVWVRAVDIQPTNPRAMHHGTAYVVPPEGQQRETLGPRFTWGLFAGYVPGREARAFPEGSGVFVPAGSRIRLQLHYTTTGRPEEDTPQLALYFAETPLPHELKFGAAVNFRFEIPAGARDHSDTAERRIDRDILVYQLTPHMHFRGKRMRFDVHYPNGIQETLLSVPAYNFNWQRRYSLAKPKAIPAGSKVVVHAGFDNSSLNPANPDPASPVFWGEQSFEEMLIGYFLYRDLAPGEAEEELATRRATAPTVPLAAAP